MAEPMKLKVKYQAIKNNEPEILTKYPVRLIFICTTT